MQPTNRALIDCYRHDVHKLNGQPHDAATETYAGVRVNQRIPHGADSDAAALSRPDGTPEQTVGNHGTAYRLSAITGQSRYDPKGFTHRSAEHAIHELLTEDDADAMHQAWLASDIVSAFNESAYYPYTSLKYHTLLVAALFDTYRTGHEFSDLHLIVDDPEQIVPHRTVYAGDAFALRIDTDTNDRPSTPLGTQPRRSWASTWRSLPAHPLDTDHDKHEMVLDANLRRIRAWSTALQYIEDFTEEFKR